MLPSLLQVIRYPRHVHTGREIGQEMGEFIIEDLLLHGQTPLTNVSYRSIIASEGGDYN